MGLFKVFSKTEEDGDPSTLRDRERILAYLEELCRVRAQVHVQLKEKDSRLVPAKVEYVKEEPPSLGLVFPRDISRDVESGQNVAMFFLLDGVRLETGLKVSQKPSGSAVVLDLPSVVRHGERRTSPRARFSSREKASVTALEGLFDGIGAAGRLLNLSSGGLCVAIERAIAIKGDRKLHPSTALFSVGAQLPIVRIQNLPQMPMLEVSGVAVHMEDASEGLCLGLSLKGVGTMETQALGQFLGKRVGTSAKTFPLRTRRRDAETETPERWVPLPEAEGRKGAPVAVSVETSERCVPPPEPSQVPQAALPGEPPGREAPTGPLPEPVRDPGPSRAEWRKVESESGVDMRLLLKKRSKRLLLVMLDDLDRAVLAGTLHVDGYPHVAEARNFIEALGAAKSQAPDLILIDQQIGVHSAQQFMDKLRAQAGCGEAPVVMLSENADVKATLMARAARFAHVQRKPVDYDGELKGVLARLLKIDA